MEDFGETGIFFLNNIPEMVNIQNENPKIGPGVFFGLLGQFSLLNPIFPSLFPYNFNSKSIGA